MSNTCPSLFLVAVPPSRCGPLRVYQKAPRRALSQAFWKLRHQKTRCGINKLLSQENCTSDLELPDDLVSCLHLCNYLQVLLGHAPAAAWEGRRRSCAQLEVAPCPNQSNKQWFNSSGGLPEIPCEIWGTTLCGQISWAVGKSVWISDFYCFFAVGGCFPDPGWQLMHRHGVPVHCMGVLVGCACIEFKKKKIIIIFNIWHRQTWIFSNAVSCDWYPSPK